MYEITGNQQEERTGMEVAIIGMSGRFPGANSIREFWTNIKNGVETVSFSAGEEPGEPVDRYGSESGGEYVRALGGKVSDKEYFAASFFDYSPLEAELMNPQTRIFHECAWEALEDAGYNPGTYEGLIGIFAGASSDFHWEAMALLSGRSEDLGHFAASHLYKKDFLCTRIAHRLNLKGPAVALQTSCSTSLVAIHLASQAILDGECDMAMAGGISITPREETGYLYREGMVLSPDGHCRAFDARAKGTIGGNGAGIVVLKLLETAISDGDHIYAIIKGTAINNDGTGKAGFTAPSKKGQVQVIQMALQAAEINPETIGYLEAHGTGTALGDPIEIAALCQAFQTGKKNYCAIGSVKTNIGHLDAAAGVAGFIKTVLALTHKWIPPSLHYENPNPRIGFENSPFYVNSMPVNWENSQRPLRAGVSSFGIGGTNAHAVLEEWPGSHSFAFGSLGSEEPGEKKQQLIVLSAKTTTALETMTQNLGRYLKENPGIPLADVAYTLQLGRKHFGHRQALVCSTQQEAITSLLSPGTPGAANVSGYASGEKNPPVVFMFPGQGSQYVNMGRQLYENQPEFRREIDRCRAILKPLTGYDIKEILFPDQAGREREKPDNTPDINQTEITQPVLFSFEYALAKLLMKWVKTPYAMVGHSIGEYVAACLAGVFSLEDALSLVVLRGRLMQGIASGSMLGVSLSREQLEPFLKEEISLAAVNSSSHCVVSGTHKAIDIFDNKMRELGYQTRRIHTSHAFHSPMMEPVRTPFADMVRQVRLNKPVIPYVSNLTGNWITADNVKDPAYWSGHLRQTVRFAAGLDLLLKNDTCIFIEVGPGRALSTFVRQHRDKKEKHQVLNLIRHPKEDVADDRYLLSRVGQLWRYGKEIQWREIHHLHHGEKRLRVSLPSYPFERKPYWIDMNPQQMKTVLSRSHPASSRQKSDIADFFYVPLWKQSLLSRKNGNPGTDGSQYLVFLDRPGPGVSLVNRLCKEKCNVITVEKGPVFKRMGPRHFRINPGHQEDYVALVNEICRSGTMPTDIIHLWNVTGDPRETLDGNGFEIAQNEGFYSLIYLSRAMGKQDVTNRFQVTVISTNIQAVTGEERLCPEKSTLLAPLKVIPQEFPGITVRSIDIDLPPTGTWKEEQLIAQLHEEILAGSTDTVVAYRRNRRWVQTYEPIRLEAEKESTTPLRTGGVYLITGGVGGIGLVLAEYLARRFNARLILTGRSLLPDRNQWKEWLSKHDPLDPSSQKIRKIQAIEKMGGQVMVSSTDVANTAQMKDLVSRAQQRFGPINGVIHAAGVTKGKSGHCAVEDITETWCNEQFHPKVHGLLTLAGVFQDKNLDFCLLTSSLAAVLGGLGFIAYSAANIFMDAFVKKYNQTHPLNWITVNWDGWHLEDIQGKESKENPEGLGITPKEGQEVFQRILTWLTGGQESQVVVSTRHLQARIDQWIKLKSLREDNPEEQEAPPQESRPDLTTPYSAPGNQTEETMVRIWQDFLGFQQVGINDDFFELGGDSLKAVTMIGKLHKALNVKIPLTEFFKKPTIKHIAGFVNESGENKYTSIKAIETKEYYALSSAQRRIYIQHMLDRDTLNYNISQTLELEGVLDRDRFEDIFRHLVRGYESYRTTFVLVNEQPVQRIHREAEMSIEYYGAREGGNVPEDQQIDLETIIRDFIRPFDLTRPPLLRVGLIRVEEEKHVLMVDMHHIAADAISVQRSVAECMELYRGNPLKPLRIQYKDFAAWQNILFKSQEFHRQEQYWLNRFKGDIPVLKLPTDYPRPPLQQFAGQTIVFDIPDPLVEQLKITAVKSEATLYMVLLAVFNILMSKYSGQDDIIMATPVAGRNHDDLDNIVGMFINVVLMRNFPAPEKTFAGFLHQVKQNTLEAFENQEYPFDQLVEKLRLKRDRSRNPLYDVVLTLLKPEALNLAVPGLTLKPYKYEVKTSQTDLRFGAMETDNKIKVVLTYSTSLFKRSFAGKLAERYIDVVKQVVENNQIKLSSIRVSSELLAVKATALREEEGVFDF